MNDGWTKTTSYERANKWTLPTNMRSTNDISKRIE